MRPSPARRLPVLLVPLLAFVAGCVPGIDWLPDSSGFVYSGGKGKKQLMLFDVKAKKSKALADNMGNTWPAVSPDGKKIAVAVRSQDGATAVYVRVQVFDREGKRLHRSKEIKWKRFPAKEWARVSVVQAGWSPEGDKLILGSVERTAVYDLKTGKATFVEGLLLTFGNRPVRPDGKGAVTVAGKVGHLWVDWAGKASPIAVGLPDRKGAQGPLEDAMFMGLALLCDSAWEGKTARLLVEEEELRLDTEKLTGQIRKGKKAGGLGAVRQAHTFPGGTTARAVVREKGDGLSTELQLEVRLPKAKGWEVAVNVRGWIKFFPSPDGRLLAVRYAPKIEALYEERKEDRILVLDADGRKLADFPVAE